MTELVLFLERQQVWAYILLGGMGFFYLRAVGRSYLALRRARFSLERQQANNQLIRAGVMAGISVVGLGIVFILTGIVAPALPVGEEPVPIPTVNLLANPEVLTDEAGEFATATPLPTGEVSALGCQNPDATISSPANEERIRGIVEILGTADIDNFAFYTLEFRSITSDGTWRAIMAGTQRVCETFCDEEELLGTWDTSLVTPADYALRLVVTDTMGNAPLPCEIRVSVLP